MYLSSNLIKYAFSGLGKIDPSTGKSRQEKISALRHLLATSELLKQESTDQLDLSVGGQGAELRKRFIECVGKVVSINESGHYTNDFNADFQAGYDYKVGSNFFTTRLAQSRNQDIFYPGRYGHLLYLQQEKVSVYDGFKESLEKYGIGAIRTELCVWLVRNEYLDIDETPDLPLRLESLIRNVIEHRYSDDIAQAILPEVGVIEAFLNDFSEDLIAEEKPDFSDLMNVDEKQKEVNFDPRILIDDLPDEDSVFITVQNLLSRGSKGILFSGPPGTSKTWYALKIAIKIVEGDESRIERVQFHPAYSYEDFIEGLVSNDTNVTGGGALFKPKDKVFLNLCTKARKDKDNLYILVIDEFSRGDPSRIFGELLTYIEPDYRELEFRLPYSEQMISIPQNIVILATMNPYDKSVADLDAAMERRFHVIELAPKVPLLTDLLQTAGLANEYIEKVVKFFNVANRLSPHGFGHTYFKSMSEEEDFILLWNHKLKFLFEKMFRFQGDAFTEVKDAYLSILSEDAKEQII
ncbi:hypothetical protein GCM10011332_27660 [Terasakiella brassicae]|uniref:ATPase dynein-related AAA domain-containing protein n=1 Tax=Terasakiella brassicae TaxID=1634917 RepID=A0A917C516_9PROT|nr:AAA family ATPase [Terasakiella brassicae]GGF72153.1 hypothetical protein GCM10011332_27660 [Terasakiella brassicae]